MVRLYFILHSPFFIRMSDIVDGNFRVETGSTLDVISVSDLGQEGIQLGQFIDQANIKKRSTF